MPSEADGTHDTSADHLGEWDLSPLLSPLFGLPRRRSLSPSLREPFCALSHLIGFILALIGGVFLVRAAAGRPLYLLGFSLYGLSLVVLYASSTLYHALRAQPRTIDHLQQFDHAAIFLLIAGTYAPVCLLVLRGAWGWVLFCVEYALALGGIGFLIWRRRYLPDAVRVALYLLMGWLVVFVFVPLTKTLSPAGLYYLVGGGILYTVGAVVFATDRPHLWPGRFSAHDLWHLFVLGGSTSHFLLMLQIAA